MYCTVLYCTALHCTAIYCQLAASCQLWKRRRKFQDKRWPRQVLCCIILCAEIHPTVLYCTVLYYSTLLYYITRGGDQDKRGVGNIEEHLDSDDDSQDEFQDVLPTPVTMRPIELDLCEEEDDDFDWFRGNTILYGQ
jgi:hypothetical protein